MAECSLAFEKFLEAITLNNRQQERIDSAVSGLTSALITKFPHLEDEQPKRQGSNANGTSVKPVSDGEYDVDIIVRTAEKDQTPEEALEAVEEALKENGIYEDKIRPRDPCIRIDYADEDDIHFHVDIVPVRVGQGQASYDAPRKNDGWHETDPESYTAWCDEQGNEFKNTVKIAKRWRDENSEPGSAIKSIVFQVLIQRFMPRNVSSQAERIVLTFESIKDFLILFETPPTIDNPAVEYEENLALRWQQSDYEDFKKLIGDAAQIARQAYDDEDSVSANLTWAELLGNAFPVLEETEILAGSTEHKIFPRDNGWEVKLNPSIVLTITAEVFVKHHKRKSLIKNYRANTHGALRAGWNLEFTADILNASSIGDVEIWYQVVNTGEQATIDEGLRGKEFFQARNLDLAPSRSQYITQETCQYLGEHYIEAFAVKNGIVIAQSGALDVKIYNKEGTPRYLAKRLQKQLQR